MTQNPNPFVRGYWNLRVVRTLCICYGDGSPHVWRSIHTSQAHLSDNDLISSPCIVTSDFALIKSGTDAISDELIAECDAVEGINGEGVVGETPWLRPGDGFEYVSGVVLNTHVGTMEGSYDLVADDGTEFAATIPRFTLTVPRTLH